MKIRKLKIKNYKIFDDMDFDFTNNEGEAIDKIVLTGINGTGKTTILELIVSAFVEKIRDNNYTDAEYFGIDLELVPNELKLFKDFLKGNSDDDILNYVTLNKNRLQLSGEEIESEIVEDEGRDRELVHLICPDTIREFKTFFTTNSNGFKIAYLNDFTNTIDVKKRSTLKLLDFDKFEENLEVYFKIVITDHLFNNRNSTAAEVIKAEIDKINNILDGIETMSKIEDIDNNKLIFKNFKGKRLLLKDLSAGEKQLFYRAIYLSALNLNDSIILVDEPELSLHPAWQKHIIKLYENIGNNNQLIISTHSPQVIASSKPEQVYLLKTENDSVVVKQPKYTEGHSIPFVLSEIMETSYKNSYVNEIVSEYLALIRKGEHNTTKGYELWKEIEKLSPESEERVKVEFSLERYNAIGK